MIGTLIHIGVWLGLAATASLFASKYILKVAFDSKVSPLWMALGVLGSLFGSFFSRLFGYTTAAASYFSIGFLVSGFLGALAFIVLYNKVIANPKAHRKIESAAHTARTNIAETSQRMK
jgi:uncharacterized membrane protein YeaQ/YmgE (transglycosylase-associated protein family)